MLLKLFKVDKNFIGFLVSIPNLLSAILYPFIGLFLDKCAKKTLFLVISQFILIASHIMLSVINEPKN